LAGNGWIGQYLEPLGIKLAFNPNGVVIALIFIGLPFVVRTVQPVLEDTEKGAGRGCDVPGAHALADFQQGDLSIDRSGPAHGLRHGFRPGDR
jgi:sulfate transport system permease protein